MELTYEKIKSIILTVLVAMSIILTLNLWSYQPIEEKPADRSMVPGVLLSEKKGIKDIVKIEQIIYNLEGNYYGTLTTKNINNLMEVISSWEFDAFSNYSLEKIDTIALNRNSVQIIYPGEIAMELFASIYKLNIKEVSNFHFNKILIDFTSADYRYGDVYFISEENQQVYLSNVLTASLNQLSQDSFEEAKKYKKYFAFKTGTGRTIYLPESETELVNNQYLFKKLPVADLKNALFSDPSIVERGKVSSGEDEYTDGRKLLIADNDSHLITFFDLSGVNSHQTETDGLLQKSINFVNNHGGWTDNYRYVGLEKGSSTVHFRIYSDGYPVFEENNPISKIEIDWAANEVSKYSRNDFWLGQPALTSIEILESGHEAIKKIKEQEREQYDENLLEDIKIGYKMTMNARTTSLEPSWFYLYSGEWKFIKDNELGGGKVGLETD